MTVAPIRHELVVEAAPEQAFRAFTEGMNRWWPREHQIGKAPMIAALVEPREGGRWYERGEDGSECDWGRVLVWQPPRKLVLAWQISAQWQFDPQLVTEVEVGFVPQGPRRTLVVLEHRDLERFGAAADELRHMMESGWATSMAAFAREAARG